MKTDYFATPLALVERMLDAVDITDVGLILDPAAGDGRLVERALVRWPRARVVAVDIDATRSQALRTRHPDWTVVHADFLTVATAVPLDAGTGKVLAVLNPPFSARGGGVTYTASFGEARIASGRAMAFVLAAASLVGDDGSVVAVVPAGAVTNARDVGARELLQRAGTLEVVEQSNGYLFPSVATRTSVVKWSPGRTTDWIPEHRAKWDADELLLDVSVARGALPVHRAKRLEVPAGAGRPFLHTTSIRRDGAISALFDVAPRRCERIVASPFVVLPRVGRPSLEKVALYTGAPAVLSDCLYALSHRTSAKAEELLHQTRAAWPRISRHFGGSCAPFLRRADVVAFARELSLEVALAGATPPPAGDVSMGEVRRRKASVR